VRNKVFEIVAEIMDMATADINESSSPQTVNKWDSLRHMKLILALEESLGIQFTDGDLNRMKDVSTILQIISARKL
jgi:acyl carrier protein